MMIANLVETEDPNTFNLAIHYNFYNDQAQLEKIKWALSYIGFTIDNFEEPPTQDGSSTVLFYRLGSGIFRTWTKLERTRFISQLKRVLTKHNLDI